MTINSGDRAHHNAASAISLNALRGQTMQRLAGVQQSLERKGISADFVRAARDPIGDMGFLGSLIANLILCAPIADFMGAQAVGDFNEAAAGAAVGGVESLSILRDEEASGYRSRRLNDYPEGRRKCAMAEGRMHRKFNLVSANQNNRLSFDAEAEMSCMHEILDMLDALERQGVSTLRLDSRQPLYDVLSRNKKKRSGSDTVKSFSMPVGRSA